MLDTQWLRGNQPRTVASSSLELCLISAEHAQPSRPPEIRGILARFSSCFLPWCPYSVSGWSAFLCLSQRVSTCQATHDASLSWWFATEITIVSCSARAGAFPCSAPNTVSPLQQGSRTASSHSPPHVLRLGQFPGDGAEVQGAQGWEQLWLTCHSLPLFLLRSSRFSWINPPFVICLWSISRIFRGLLHFYFFIEI